MENYLMTSTKAKTDWNDFAETLKSAAHPERLAILDLMCTCGYDQIMVKNIYETLRLEQPITSRHLGIMRKSGLLKREVKEGKTFYCFNNNNVIAQGIRRLLMK